MVNKSKVKFKNKKSKILLNYKDKLIKERIKNTVMYGGMQKKRKKFKNLKSEKKPKKESRIILNHKRKFNKEGIIQQNGTKESRIILNHKRRFNKERIIQQNGTIQEKSPVRKLKPVKSSFKLERISKKEIRDFSEKVKKIKQEIGKIIIGQEKVIDGLIRALVCKGHIILEGVPGIAKTLLIKSLGRVSGCKVKRIQFTVDLLPTDILGLTIYREKLGFEVVKGPIFANFIIADEINRAPPKTQSALLEAMQEKQVTIGKKTFLLPRPFFVMATKNPIETTGVYALPEAQTDRFLFKLIITYPQVEEEKLIMKRNIELQDFEDFNLQQIMSIQEIMHMQQIVKQIYLSKILENYIVNIVDYTRNRKSKYSKYIEWGGSPRASIAFFMASKAEALMKGRNFVLPEDVKSVAFDILRHRLILTYEAEADNIDADCLIQNILNEVKI